MTNQINVNQLLREKFYLTDGGLETDFIFNRDIDLPHFASFHVLNKPRFQKAVRSYYTPYMNLAKQYDTGFILECTTWRAHSNWGYKLGYTPKELVGANKRAVNQMKSLKADFVDDIPHILISGCIGPRYDGYVADSTDSREDARIYHSPQIKTLKDSGVDMISALTMTNIEEALGIVLAARDIGVPVVISFTVETDGSLPDGNSLLQGIQEIDDRSGEFPDYYMINCAHPQHFEKRLTELNGLAGRLQGLRANASCKSHAELDEATELDAGNKEELAEWYGVLKNRHTSMRVFGGCCGTDISHLEAICRRLFEQN